MATSPGQPKRSRDEWEEIGKEAILDLLAEQFVVPWAEVEGRIANQKWKDFDVVQPVQLSGARRQLRDEGLIVESVSNQNPPVHLIHLPIPDADAGKRKAERLIGSRRKAFRKYLSWAGDQGLCGKHAEKVVLASMQASATEAGLFIPQQTVGSIESVKGVDVPVGPLDALAHILEPETVEQIAPLVVEVKNVHDWIYPSARELWSLLVKAAGLATHFPVVPLLVCVRYAFMTQNMASDLGFFLCAMRRQLFSPEIDEDEFGLVQVEFGLSIEQHGGPREEVCQWLGKVLRRSPPLSPPRGEEIEWCRRQAQRFAAIAPVITEHAALAEALEPDARRRVFRRFATRVMEVCDWPTLRQWS